jgi:UDPglucose 6-dehydrogenase
VLTAAGAEVVAYDPEAIGNVKGVIGDKITYADDHYEALKGADALVIATEWQIFRNPDFMHMANLLGNKAIFDGRNLYNLDEMEEHGFYYTSIGRNTVIPS